MKTTKIILTCFLSLLLSFSITSKTFAQDAQSTSKRLWGQDRYQTAVAISNEGWKQANYVILATGENFPDAIAAAPLGKKYDAPILLTEKDNLNQDTKKELLRLGTQNVFIVGGQGVITANVESELNSLNITVTRLAGADRYETAVKIAEMVCNNTDVIFTTGEDFPDALSIAPFAAKMGIPILLIQPNEVPECVNKYISSKSITTNVYFIGDNTMFPESLKKQYPIVRGMIYGNNRYQTNQKAISEFQSTLNSNTFYVATGNGYADALTGSVLAAKTNSPILYVGSDQDWRAFNRIYYNKIRLSDGKIMNSPYTTPIILGGEGVVSYDTENIVNNYKNIADKAYAIKGFGGSVTICQIFIDGEWAYYTRLGSYFYSDEVINFWGENAVYKMKLDGSENTRVFFDGGDVNNYTFDYISKHYSEFSIDKDITITKIENNWIYYNVSNFASSKNYKIKTDGTEKQEI